MTKSYQNINASCRENFINQPEADSLILIGKLDRVDIIEGHDHSRSQSVVILSAARWCQVSVVTWELSYLEKIMLLVNKMNWEILSIIILEFCLVTSKNILSKKTFCQTIADIIYLSLFNSFIFQQKVDLNLDW